MKRLFPIILLSVVLLDACATPNPTPIPTPAPTLASTLAEETAIRNLVESFGKRLGMVSLLSPRAAQDIQDQYSAFVSPGLLQTWMSDLSKAPGRVVSSPWPDRIEITTLTKGIAEEYSITGFVVNVTSVEMVNGGAASKIPVQIGVQKIQGRWAITAYTEKK